MKKIIFATSVALLISTSSCKETNPCGKTEDPYAMTPAAKNMLKSEFKIFIKVSPRGPNSIISNVYNEQNTLIPLRQIDGIDTYYDTKMPVVGIMGSDIFANSAFGAGVPTSHVLYLKFTDNDMDTLRIDTRVKSFCDWDSIAYFRTTYNNMPMQELTKNSTSYEFYNHILIQR